MKNLRHVKIDDYELKLWETDIPDSRNNGRNNLGYEFIAPDGSVLFKGEDFCSSPLESIDSDNVLRCLLGFLTLKPGDTDDEYFADYTEAQMDFAQGDAEELSLWAMDYEPGEGNLEFVNLDGWNDYLT